MYKEKRYILLTIFLFFQIGVVKIISYYPGIVDQFYVKTIYPFISNILRFIFGWIPFSIGDILYAFLIYLILRFIYKMIVNKNRNRIKLMFQFLAGLSLFYFFFYLFWGINYSRLAINKSLSLEKEVYNIEKLESVTLQLLDRSMKIHQSLTTNDTLAIKVPYSKKEILQLTKKGYDNLGEKFDQFKYHPVSLKKSLFSLPLTYMGFLGYFNPLSGEAQVDYLIPKINLPFTCSHEVAHQLGIASESEANFVGFLASAHNDDLYFQYSAYLLALRYALHDIYRYDKNLYKNYIGKIPKGILKNMRESDEFWKRYENPLEPLFKLFYDNYLKYNQQKDGLQSYNQIMDLIISYERKYSLNIN